MTLKKFMFIDILILSVIALTTDWIAFALGNLIFNSIEVAFVITPSILFVLFIYIRWGFFGIIAHVVLLANQFLIFRNALVYEHFWLSLLLSYLILAIVLCFVRFKDKILKSKLKTFALYFLLPFGLYIAIEMIFLGVLAVLINHSINFIVLSIAMIIAQRQPDFLTDMPKYLIKVEKERNEKKARIESND